MSSVDSAVVPSASSGVCSLKHSSNCDLAVCKADIWALSQAFSVGLFSYVWIRVSFGCLVMFCWQPDVLYILATPGAGLAVSACLL